MKIYLIRHAEEGEGGHLSEQGQHQAEALGKWLADKNIGEIFSSDRARAKETAETAAANLELVNQIVPNLEEAQELELDETDDQSALRADQGLRWILEKAGETNLAIVAHSRLIRLLLAYWGLHKYVQDQDLQNTGVVTLSYQNGQYRLLDYEIVPH